MANNNAKYGFRWHSSLSGSAQPVIIEGFVDDDQSFDVNGGASNVALRAGDPVRRKSTGGFEQADGAEGAGGAEAIFGIVMGIGPYYDGEQMVRRSSLPADVSYDSNLERQSKILVCPIDSAVWEIDVDDATTATTLAAYQAFVGENADHILTAASGTKMLPKLDISSHATTGTLILRIVGIAPTLENVDFAGANVKLLVEANVAQRPWSSATGV